MITEGIFKKMVSSMPLNMLVFLIKAMSTGQEGENTSVTEGKF